MKFKALRYKKSPSEFATIDLNDGTYILYTHELPNPQPETVTMELMRGYYEQHLPPLPPEISLDDFEYIEMECFEANTVGADIRNKLSPSLNLVALLEVYFKEKDEEKKNKLMEYIKKEMKMSKKNIKYISNLL